MSDRHPALSEHYVAPFSDETAFEELQDAAPSGKFRLSVTGWIGTVVVTFWVFIAIFGQLLAPYDENDLPFPDAYSEYQAPQPGAWLGTDVDDRDVLSRILFGAGRTLGISVAATVLAYVVGVVLGVGGGGRRPQGGHDPQSDQRRVPEPADHHAGAWWWWRRSGRAFPSSSSPPG